MTLTKIYTIGGFTEDDGDRSGTNRLYRNIVKDFSRRIDVEVSPLRPWHSDWEGLAAQARLESVEQAVVIGYSWGGGYGAQKLSGHLGDHNIPVVCQMLCDPVYRPLWLPIWGPANIFGFRALIPGWPKIKVPDNVEGIVGFRQCLVTPKGHDLIHRGKRCSLPVLAHTTHVEIDDDPRWHALVRRHLETMFPTLASSKS